MLDIQENEDGCVTAAEWKIICERQRELECERIRKLPPHLRAMKYLETTQNGQMLTGIIMFLIFSLVGIGGTTLFVGWVISWLKYLIG